MKIQQKPETKLKDMKDYDLNNSIQDSSFEKTQWDTRELRKAVQLAQE